MIAVDLHIDAMQELDRASREYDLKEENLGRELLAEAEAMIADIAEWPGLGSPYGQGSYRFRLLRRFPYVIYYREDADAVFIAAIAHKRQRPNYWVKRRRSG